MKNITRAFLFATALILTGCADEDHLPVKHLRPIPSKTMALMADKGMTKADPILMRIFKEENVLEIWKRTSSGQYAFLKKFEICKWSGALGPKFKEGDRQAPEGFYFISPGQMNPRSSYHLSFNMGFPNAYDRAHGRTGLHLMVHGACSSAGCYSMTDEYIEEIYAIAREAFNGGQRSFQVQAFPFRMTEENMAKHTGNPHYGFWRMLKAGYDAFEVAKREPRVDVCEKRYVVNARWKDERAPLDPSGACPSQYGPTEDAPGTAQQYASVKPQVTPLTQVATAAQPSVIRDIKEPSAVAVASTSLPPMVQEDRSVRENRDSGVGTLPSSDPAASQVAAADVLRPLDKPTAVLAFAPSSGASAASGGEGTATAPSATSRMLAALNPFSAAEGSAQDAAVSSQSPHALAGAVEGAAASDSVAAVSVPLPLRRPLGDTALSPQAQRAEAISRGASLRSTGQGQSLVTASPEITSSTPVSSPVQPSMIDRLLRR